MTMQAHKFEEHIVRSADWASFGLINTLAARYRGVYDGRRSA
jgi:hypothetical protein